MAMGTGIPGQRSNALGFLAGALRAQSGFPCRRGMRLMVPRQRKIAAPRTSARLRAWGQRLNGIRMRANGPALHWSVGDRGAMQLGSSEQRPGFPTQVMGPKARPFATPLFFSGASVDSHSTTEMALVVGDDDDSDVAADTGKSGGYRKLSVRKLPRLHDLAGYRARKIQIQAAVMTTYEEFDTDAVLNFLGKS